MGPAPSRKRLKTRPIDACKAQTSSMASQKNDQGRSLFLHAPRGHSSPFAFPRLRGKGLGSPRPRRTPAALDTHPRGLSDYSLVKELLVRKRLWTLSLPKAEYPVFVASPVTGEADHIDASFLVNPRSRRFLFLAKARINGPAGNPLLRVEGDRPQGPNSFNPKNAAMRKSSPTARSARRTKLLKKVAYAIRGINHNPLAV
jgi:hypothetical protein